MIKDCLGPPGFILATYNRLIHDKDKVNNSVLKKQK